jgi:hypothetical protein
VAVAGGTAAAIAEFATAHGLGCDPTGELRELTPALITGSHGSNTSITKGKLARDLEGTLCEHVFADGSARHESTIVLTAVPETVAYAPALVCRDRATLGAVPAQLPIERWTETELESTVFNRRYRLLALAGQNQSWIRELFSPELIAWLATEAPAGLSFELNEGNLVIALPGPPADAAAVERLVTVAAELRRRIRGEALEEEADPDVFDESADVAKVVETMKVVEWKNPPTTVSQAGERYAHAARWKARVVANASFVAAICFGISCTLLWLVAGALLGVVGGFIVGVAGFSVGRWYASYRYRWGDVSVQRVALEAWVRGYAKSRKLELVDRWRWHSDRRALPLPGFADHVLAGEIAPDTRIDGWFAMLGDAAEMRSTGEEIAYVSDRPLASSALVVKFARSPSDAAIAALELPEGYKVEHGGHEVAVWLPIQGNLTRTSKGSDAFRKKAGALLVQLKAGL